MLDLSVKSVTWMIVSALLFIALTPGVLLTVGGTGPNLVVAGDRIISAPTLIHAVVFAVVLSVVGKQVVNAVRSAIGMKNKAVSAVSSTIKSATK